MLSEIGHFSPKASHLQGLSNDPSRRQKCSFAPIMRFSASFQFPLLQPVVLFSPSVFPVSALKVFISLGTSENIFCVHAQPAISPGLAGGFLASKCGHTSEHSAAAGAVATAKCKGHLGILVV